MSVCPGGSVVMDLEDGPGSSAWGWQSVLGALVLLLGGPCLAHGQSYVGRGHRVLDGDTVHLLRRTGQIVRIELYGVDAPEPGQPLADAAARAVRDAVFRTKVQARVEARDSDGRPLFVVRGAGRVLNEHLLRTGLAWWDRQQAAHDDRYRRLEQRARAAERGLWARPDPVPPWAWREEEAP